MDKQFEKYYLQRPKPSLIRCEVKTKNEQCRNTAKYVLSYRDHIGYVCTVCLPSWINELTKNDIVIIKRTNYNIKELL